MSATDAAIQKKTYISWTTAWIILNEQFKDKKIVQTLEELESSIKGISETIKKGAKEQKCEFLSIILRNLPSSILGSALTGRGVIRVGDETIRAGENF